MGHPFTEQPHIMITSTTGELKVDEIIQSEAVSQIVKTQTWADHATVIRKNHIGHIAVNTNFYDSDLCIENVRHNK